MDSPVMGGAGGVSRAFVAFFLISVMLEFLVVGFNMFYLARDGQSLGKKATHIRIVNADGSKASFVKLVFLRGMLAGVLGLIPFFSMADALFIFRNDRRTIHDMIAGTIVISR
jgi:uncharacterized RDD family membrane protein YckC